MEKNKQKIQEIVNKFQNLCEKHKISVLAICDDWSMSFSPHGIRGKLELIRFAEAEKMYLQELQKQKVAERIHGEFMETEEIHKDISYTG